MVRQSVVCLFALVAALPLHVRLAATLARNQAIVDIRAFVTDTSVQGAHWVTVTCWRVSERQRDRETEREREGGREREKERD